MMKSRYHMSDDEILDTRIARLVQEVHTIQHMIDMENKMRRIELTWQTRAFCSFIASTVEDEKSRNALFNQAMKLTLVEDELDDTNDSAIGDDGRSLEDIMENGNVEAALARNNRRVGPGIDAMRYSR